jgi:HEAT repeat protein
MTEVERQQDPNALVAALADPERREAAFAALRGLGSVARAAVRAGLRDGRWQVRRGCVLWFWRNAEPEDLPALVPLLRDPRSKVRQTAVISVGQGRGSTDVVPLLIERALQDENLRVRRQAVSLLAWEHAHPDLEGFFAGLLATERDAALHKQAGLGLLRCREAASC